MKQLKRTPTAFIVIEPNFGRDVFDLLLAAAKPEEDDDNVDSDYATDTDPDNIALTNNVNKKVVLTSFG